MTNLVTVSQAERDPSKIVFCLRQVVEHLNNLDLTHFTGVTLTGATLTGVTRFQLTGTTFASLPPAVTGTIAYITDGSATHCGDGTCSTWGTAVTGGGGSLPLLIWYDGAFWTLIGN